MKKLMMAVAIVCATVGVQAASINWANVASTSPILDLAGSKLTYANAAAYSFQIFLVDSDGNTVGNSASINNMSAGGLTGATFTYTYDSDYSNGDTFTILAKMTVAGKAYEMEFGSFAIASSDDTGTDKFTWTAGNYGGLSGSATAGSEASWSPVPEPTSGLLMLLGMAGLALKRKRA